MKVKFAKWVSGLILVGIIAIVYWYATFFAPHIASLRSFSDRGLIEAGMNVDILHRYAIKAESKERIRRYATKKAFRSLVKKSRWLLDKEKRGQSPLMLFTLLVAKK
jgi:hypothetical protein